MTDASPAARPRVRLFVDAALAAGARVELDAGQAHYLRRVMRLGAGDAVAAFNGADGEWRAEVAPEGRAGCALAVAAPLRPQGAEPDLWLAFAPVKRLRVDYMAQKATELGASLLQPVMTRRTGVERVKVERLRANAVEAAEQCGRLSVPAVAAPQTLDRFLAGLAGPEAPGGARRLFWADEGGAGRPALAAFAEAGPAPAAVLIGPEGGFDDAERAALRGLAGTVAIGLGPRILRADTAAVAALALWQAAAGDWAAEESPAGTKT